MNSFWKEAGGDSRRPELSTEPAQTETEENAHRRSWVPGHLDKARFLIFARLHRIVLQKRHRKRPRQRRIVRLREAIQLGALQVLAPPRDTHAGAGKIYARAHVAHTELTECYSYEQEISRNPTKRELGSPAGHIELRIPYDGHKFFTR